jgi:hypothetical protein
MASKSPEAISNGPGANIIRSQINNFSFNSGGRHASRHISSS